MKTKPKAPLLRTLQCSIGTAFLAGTLFSPVSLVAEDEFRSDDTDIYGNHIYTNSAGNPHVWFDEGEAASCTAEALLRRVHCRRQPEGRASVCAATSRRGSLLYKGLKSNQFYNSQKQTRKLGTSNVSIDALWCH